MSLPAAPAPSGPGSGGPLAKPFPLTQNFPAFLLLLPGAATALGPSWGPCCPLGDVAARATLHLSFPALVAAFGTTSGGCHGPKCQSTSPSPSPRGSAAPGAGRGREKLELSREGGAGSSAGCRERGLGAAGMSPCRAALCAGMLPAGSAAFAIPTGKAGIRDQSGRVRHPLVLLGSPPPPGVLRGLLELGLGRLGRAETRREKGIPAAVGQGRRTGIQGDSGAGAARMGCPGWESRLVLKQGAQGQGGIHLSLLNPLLNHVLVREWGGSINVNKPFFNGPNNAGNSLLGYRPFFNPSPRSRCP